MKNLIVNKINNIIQVNITTMNTMFKDYASNSNLQTNIYDDNYYKAYFISV